MTPARSGLDEFGDQREHTVGGGGKDNLAVQAATVDAGNEDRASEKVALDAFPSERAGTTAPWRSPMAFQAAAPRAELFPPVDDHVSPSDHADDTAVSWDMAPVHPASPADISATDSTMSAAASSVSSPLRRLGLVAVTLLVLAAVALIVLAVGVNLLPAADQGMSSAVAPEPATSAPAIASLDPASSGLVENTAGTSGAVPDPDDRRASEAPPSTPVSASANAPPSTLPSSREDAVAATVARGNRSDTADLAPPPATPAPARNSATTPLPPPLAADTAARTDAPSAPAASSSETTVRTLPPASASEGTSPALPPASRIDASSADPIRADVGSSPAAPAIPPAGTVDRAEADGEAAAKEGIAEALRRLQLAYEQRDVTLVKAVWPTVNERALARAFDGLRSQRVVFDQCWMNVFSVSADVECRGVMTYVPRVGSSDRRTESRQWTFRVQKGDEHWLIVSAEAR